jgi:hypothetical protein
VLLRGATAATAVVLLAGCGGSGKQAAPTTGSELPPGCSVDQVDAIVTAFLADPDLAPAPFFQLYAASESDQRAFRTRRRRAALTHLHARLAIGERDRLLELRDFGQDINHVHITYRLTRYAPDFRSRGIHGRLARGVGTVDCAHGRVAAWAMKGP